MAFTTITNGTDLQNASLVNELRNACRERYYVLTAGSDFADVSAGDDIQSQAFWSGMQNFLESYCSSFVNMTATIEGELEVPMWSLSTWRAAAGLNASGFKRAPKADNPIGCAWPSSFSYGQIQVGDIIGPWIYQELQAGLEKLMWTKKSTSAGATTGTDWYARGNNQWVSPFYQGSDTACDNARTAAMNDYATGWFDTSVSPLVRYYYQATRYAYYWFGGPSPVWRWNEIRCKGKPIFLNIYVPPSLTYDWDAYVLVNAQNGQPDSGTNFEEGLNLYESDSGASGTSLQTDYPSAAEGDLINGWSVSCPLPGPDKYEASETRYSQDARAVLKWNFTYGA